MMSPRRVKMRGGDSGRVGDAGGALLKRFSCDLCRVWRSGGRWIGWWKKVERRRWDLGGGA